MNTITPLKILTDLFAAFHQNDIRYCHWKSNDHVAEGLAGITDLDILVDRRQQTQVLKVLAAQDFKRGTPGFGLRYPGVEGYIGLDPDSGKMAYVHLHYRLVLGKKRIKEFVFPWEEQLLATRHFDAEHDVYVADPNLEMLLLLVRASLKIRARDRLYAVLGKKRFGRKWTTQFEWLTPRVDRQRCEQLSRQLLGAKASVRLNAILSSGKMSLDALRRLGKTIEPRSVLYRTYAPMLTPPVMWARESFSALSFLNRKYFGGKLPLIRKGLASGGVFIVFIGPDGAGKSTLTREMAKLFSWKIDVFRAYLGAGDGTVAFYRWGLVKAKQMAEKFGVLKSKAKSESAPSPRHPKRPSAIVSGAKIIWALTLALEKRSKLKAAWQARNRGQIVICDRYPQTQLMGFNDGPLLSHWIGHRNRWLAKIAAWEMAPYQWADRNPPDLVIRLNVDLETAKERDPEMSRAFLQRRIEAVRSFRFGAHTPVIEIDANQPVDAVVLQTQNAIWPHI